MPAFPLIDTHVHFWDPRRLKYSWQNGNALLERPYETEGYKADSQNIDTEAYVFVECDADAGQSLNEIDLIEEQAQRDPRLRAIVATAPLELGARVESLLREIVSRSSKVRGIRRILEYAPDPQGLMRSPDFIDGVRQLSKLGLHFEITVNYIQMGSVPEFVQKVQDVPLILDHCGKPGIRGGHITAFEHDVRKVARYSHVYCKLSGLTTEANHLQWTEDQLLPFIDVALQAFGPERVIYGSDWPVCLQATTLDRWVRVLDRALAGFSQIDRRRIYRDNANQFYRLGLG